MARTIQEFYEECAHKRIAFIGVGVSHRKLMLLFRRRGLDITLCDKRTMEQLQEDGPLLQEAGVQFDLGEGYLDHLDRYDIIFRTPGMYYNHPKLKEARGQGKVVTSEMEVFFELCPCKRYAVTGSDGKTTTTTLIAKMLEQEGRTVHLGGNIGRPLLCDIETIQPQDAAVVELSSFQLISMRQSPDVAVITNVAPNHLDVHGTMEEYVGSKTNILLHQNAFSKAVLNRDNAVTRDMEPLVRGDLWEFSRQEQPACRGTWLNEKGEIWVKDGKQTCKVLDASEIRIPGIHNVENYLTAIAAVWGEVQPENIRKIAREFNGVEHRIELTRERHGVKWYNDSIASSPSRTIAGLNSFRQKVILIAGGYDKKIPFAPLAPKVVEKVKALILMGDTADKLQQAVTQDPGYDPALLPIFRVDNMEQAVAKADALAEEGDIVTLSPACASFDQYRNFELRGKHYKELVNRLPE